MTEKAKGGNWEVRKNPFPTNKRESHAPALAEIGNLGAVIDVVLREGCALIIGHTRDGGAIVLTILDGDLRHRTYCSSDGELVDAITALHETYRGG